MRVCSPHLSERHLPAVTQSSTLLLFSCLPECCMLNIFYTHVCTVRWKLLGVCCVCVCIKACFFCVCVCVCVCVCIKTYLQIYFWLLPGSPSFKQENVGYSHILTVIFWIYLLYITWWFKQTTAHLFVIFAFLFFFITCKRHRTLTQGPKNF